MTLDARARRTILHLQVKEVLLNGLLLLGGKDDRECRISKTVPNVIKPGYSSS